MAENKTALDIALENVEQKFSSTDGVRGSLTEKLKTAINQMTLDFNNDPPRMIEVKLAAMKTLDDLLSSAESSAVTVAKTQMQRKHDETSEASKQMVIEMLRNITIAAGHNTGSGVRVPTANVAAAVEKACQETNHPIAEDELSVPEVPLKDVE